MIPTSYINVRSVRNTVTINSIKDLITPPQSIPFITSKTAFTTPSQSVSLSSSVSISTTPITRADTSTPSSLQLVVLKKLDILEANDEPSSVQSNVDRKPYTQSNAPFRISAKDLPNKSHCIVDIADVSPLPIFSPKPRKLKLVKNVSANISAVLIPPETV